MNFTAFKRFNDSYLGKYQRYFDLYPHAMSVLDKELRVYHAGCVDIFENNIERLARTNRVNVAYRVYLRLMLFFYRSLPGPQWLIVLGNFKLCESIIDEIARKNSIRTTTKKISGFRNLLSLMLLQRIGIGFVIFQTPAIASFYRRLRENGLMATLDNGKVMRAFDRLVAKELDWAKALLVWSNVEEIIALDDCSPASVIICDASRMIGSRFTVVAHGYVQDPLLISICPIRANVLVLWTRLELCELTKVLSDSQAAKLRWLGFPKVHEAAGMVAASKRVLFISEPIRHQLMNEGYMNILMQIMEGLASLGYEFIFRRHPQERDNTHVDAYVLRYGIQESGLNLNEELDLACCVMGSNSSVLMEAHHSGIPVCQIRELSAIDFEGVIRHGVDEIPDFLQRLPADNIAGRKRACALVKTQLVNEWERYLLDATNCQSK